MASNSDPSILAYDVLRDNKPKSRSANPPDIPMYSEINQESQSGESNIPRSENTAFDNQVYSGSTGTEENMYSKLSTTTVAVQDPPRENKVKSSHEKNWQSDKKFACVLVTIAFLIVAVVVTLVVAITATVQLSQLQASIRSIQQLTDELESLGLFPSHPAPSCAAILQFAPSSPSGHYWIRSSNGSAVHVYCHMIRSCGNITGGWMRVAELDMRDSSSQCPSTLRMGTACNPTRTCVINSDNANCSSVSFTTHGFNYSRVCGMIRAYQVGVPDAFGNHGNPKLRNFSTLDSNYVDGISLTRGVPQRQHIWTFATEAGT